MEILKLFKNIRRKNLLPFFRKFELIEYGNIEKLPYPCLPTDTFLRFEVTIPHKALMKHKRNAATSIIFSLFIFSR